MKKLLICIVSAQSVPNIFSIDYFMPDSILFLYTKEFKKNISYTLYSAELLLKSKNSSIVFVEKQNNGECFYKVGDNVHTLKISEESVYSDVENLKSWLLKNGNDYDEIIYNITGGTKLMSISLYDVAKSNNKNIPIIIYMPIGKNTLITNIAQKNEEVKAINTRLSVNQFCAAYGVEIINERRLNEKISHAVEYKNVSKWLINNYFIHYEFNNNQLFVSPAYRLLSCLFQKLKPYRDRKDKFKQKNFILEFPSKEFKLYEKEAALAKKLFAFEHFNNRSHIKELPDKTQIEVVLDKKDVDFFTGGWLEEFCFNEINELKNETDDLIDDILINPDIKYKDQNAANNEIDVMFTSRNRIYMVECKSLQQQQDKANEIIYKINAIQGKVGRLSANSFLVSTAIENILEKPKKNNKDFQYAEFNIKESAKDRAKELNTTIIHPFKIAKELKSEIKKVLEES